MIDMNCNNKVLIVLLDNHDIKDTIKILNSNNINNVVIKENNIFDMECCINNILHELGIPSHIKGYLYLKDALFYLYNNNEIYRKITKSLYPNIAKKYNTKVSNVERNIRHAIEVSFIRGNLNFIHDIFGHSIDSMKSKATNSEYLITVANKLKVEYKRIIC